MCLEDRSLKIDPTWQNRIGSSRRASKLKPVFTCTARRSFPGNDLILGTSCSTWHDPSFFLFSLSIRYTLTDPRILLVAHTGTLSRLIFFFMHRYTLTVFFLFFYCRYTLTALLSFKFKSVIAGTHSRLLLLR